MTSSKTTKTIKQLETVQGQIGDLERAIEDGRRARRREAV